ncbi:MFS transporter [Chloroflexota bacterium]
MTSITKKSKPPKIFIGWWTVLGGGTIALWAAGFYVYGISALFKPISAELGFSRLAVSGAASIGRFEGGFEGLIAGWITDKYGPRWPIILGVLSVATALILMNFVDSLWAFYVVWGVFMGTGHNLANGVPTDTAVANWFVKKRGAAQGVKWVLAGLSGMLVLPLIAWLIETQGWRMTCIIGGISMAAIGIPLAWFSIRRHRPEYYGLLPDGAALDEKSTDTAQVIEKGVQYAEEVKEIEFTMKQAFKTPTLWLLLLVQSVHGLVAPIMSIHCIPFLTDRGIEPLMAAGMMAIMVTCSVPTRFVVGLIADRIRKDRLRFLMGTVYLLQASGFIVFLLNQTLSMIYVWFVLYGIGLGAGFIISPLIMARYFGRKAYGSIRGTAMMIMTPIGIIAPLYVGWIYDSTGSYINALFISVITLSAAAIIASFIPPAKPPAEITGIHESLS